MKVDNIMQLLPSVMRRTLRENAPLQVLLEVMESLHAEDEARLANLAEVFDPRRTQSAFLPMLAHWMNLDRLFQPLPNAQGQSQDTLPSRWQARTLPLPEAVMRELIAQASHLSQWRGTPKGLVLFLEIATGLKGIKVVEQVYDAQGQVRPFHIEIHLPPQAESVRELIERIVSQEKPAYITNDLVIEKSASPAEGT